MGSHLPIVPQQQVLRGIGIDFQNFHARTNISYLGLHSLNVVMDSENDIGLDDILYIVLLSFEDINKPDFELTLTNFNNEALIYTMVFDQTVYNQLCQNNSYLFPFEAFSSKLRGLFLYHESQKLSSIKLVHNVNGFISLGFNMKSSLQTVQLFSVPLRLMEPRLIVNYFQNKAKFYVDKANKESSNNCDLQVQCLAQENMMLSLSNQLASHKCEISLLQNNIATQKEELAAKNIELLTAQAELTGLKALVESQHHSINMVTNITEFLEQHMQQETQRHLEESANLTEKYKDMKRMFSTTLSDFVKHQLYFNQILKLNELSTAENAQLKSEIEKCVQAINFLKNYVKDVVQEEEVASVETQNTRTREIITRLQVQLNALKQTIH